MYAGQPLQPVLSILPQRLPEHKLPTIGEISGIEPVMKAARLEAHHTRDRRPCRACIDTRDQEIRIRHIS
jgi:hypothetical protein